MFVLNSDITIGGFRFSGVHDVVIRRSMKTVYESATIKLPHMARIKSTKHSFRDPVSVRTVINDGAAVTINLGYNGDLREEFKGFVKRRGRDMPMTVECEGYVRQLRQDVDVSKHYKKTTAKELLLDACEGTDISVLCDDNFPIAGIRLTHVNGLQIIDWIREASAGALTVFFKQPDVLWCGLAYTAYATDSDANPMGFPTVNYRLGWNCIKDNGLKERIPSEPVQVILNGKLVTGNVVMTESKNKAAKNKLKCLLSHVPDAGTMGKFAQEKEWLMNYTGAEGYVSGFLQPYALPGYDAYITDTEDGDLNGTYLVESTEVTFGVRGARRKITVGPKVGFDAD